MVWRNGGLHSRKKEKGGGFYSVAFEISLPRSTGKKAQN
jgi:hypothetical protein